MRFLFLVVMLLPTLAFAQNAADSAGVVVHVDPRLSILLSNMPESGYQSLKSSIRSVHGYRIQIYNGRDRNEAQQRKIEFIRSHPDTRAYLSYMAPTYRLKVGDFKTREDAIPLYRELTRQYSPCMIVPDIVVLNLLRNEN